MSIKPHKLRPGDRVGVIAPAGPVDPHELNPSLDLIRESGYEVVEGDHLYGRHDYLAGTDDDRLNDLHSMFDDKGIRAVLCARGGYGTIRLLDRIDYKLIEKNPKILVGYSDITALLLAVYLKTGLIVFHGPMIKGLIDSEKCNLDVLMGHISSGQYDCLDLSEGVALRGGSTEGVMLGGNLSLINCMIGTPFMPSLDGKILFIEDRGEPLYRIDRMLAHLRLSGAFSNIRGMVAGSFIACGKERDINELLLGVTSGYSFPVISNISFGHGSVNTTLPIGIKAELDTDKKILKYSEEYIEN